jgi:hypothetical protein
MLKKGRFILFAALLLLVLAQPALSALRAVGPINPTNGFPLWYADTTGAIATLPAPPIGDGVNPPTMVFDPPVAGNAFSQQIGFGTEAMYWIAVSKIALPGGGLADLTLALEAAFGGGAALNGDQITFSRVRIRIDTPSAGTYTVTHPYGSKSFTVAAAGTKSINDTIDIGIAPRVFTGALKGDIGPFLRQVSPAPAAGWLGDGATAVVAGDPGSPGATVTGSPTGNNFFRIDGPNIGGPGINTIQSNLFTVNAKLFDGTPFTVTRASFTRGVAGIFAEVFATTPRPLIPGIALTATLPGQAAVPLTRTGVSFFARIPFTAAFTPSVTVTGTINGVNPTSITKTLVDTITITKATYSVGTGTLTVAALSSDNLATLRGFGWVGAGAGGQLLNAAGADTTFLVATPPSQVTVKSSSGGKATATIIILP